MLTIRLRRLGAKKRPFFRIVVIDSLAPRDGRSLDVLGHYNPTTQPEAFAVDRERMDHWMTRGARPSQTVRTLLRRHPPDAAPDAPAAPAPSAAVEAGEVAAP